MVPWVPVEILNYAIYYATGKFNDLNANTFFTRFFTIMAVIVSKHRSHFYIIDAYTEFIIDVSRVSL